MINVRHYDIMYGFRDRILVCEFTSKDDGHESLTRVADTFEAYLRGILTDRPEDGENTLSE
jgi:dsRNA-specific ribonuclease